MPEKLYTIVRTSEGVKCFVSEDDGDTERAVKHVVYHSPTGFECGYGGSGPADLALSILADYLNEDPRPFELYAGQAKCWKLHQTFKWKFIAPMVGVVHWIKEEQIEQFLETEKAKEKLER